MDFWDDDLTGPVREEPDFEAEAAEALAEHEGAEHGGDPCDCPPAPWPDPAKTTWLCGDPATQDRLGLARKAAAELGAEFDVMLAQARELSGACCDCEIIFNCDDRPEDDDA